MKRNTILRVSAILLVLTLLSTCVISGTFAKYTTSTKANDDARIAKWGVVVNATADSFTNDYTNDTAAITVASSDDTVISFVSGENVLAPGTDGNLCGLTITGQPEVAVKIDATAELELTDWAVDSAYYCPLVITVGTTEFKGNDYADAEAFEKAVEDAIVAEIAVASVDPNTDLADAVAVTWAWAYEGNDDVKDTALGNAAAPATISIAVSVTVTQID